ncbi:MAG: AAA family ATPase [Myxococcales bacterium]|nr:AAA family ATPase [Myxococcales bacterium]
MSFGAQYVVLSDQSERPSVVRYVFGECELELGSYSLLRRGRTHHLTPKVFELLRYLIEQRGRLVSKDELLDRLWADSHVSEVAVPWAISHARRAMGQASRAKAPIETVYGRGYRFVAEVQEVLSNAPVEPPPEPPAAFSSPPPPWADPPFVGRRTLMATLRTQLATACAGRGGVQILAGPGGIGKTRCMEELGAFARGRGMAVWTARCSEFAAMPAFWLWVQVLRELARDRPGLGERARVLLDALCDGAARHVSDAATPARSFWLLEEVCALLGEAARETPLLLLLDDLQWSDAASLELLCFFAPELSRLALQVVVGLREGPGPREKLLRRLARHAEQRQLEPLSPEDIGAYLAVVTAAPAPDRCLSEALQRATAGNPLFLTQAVRELVAEHGRAELNQLDPEQIAPLQSAQQFLRSAVEVLEPETRHILQVASVLGEEVEIGLLQALCGTGGDALLAALDAADEHGLVVPELPTRFRFRHALLCSALYEGVGAAERAQLHRRAAHLLEARARGAMDQGEIARHYHRSLALGDYAAIVHACRRAATMAHHAQAYADAVSYSEWALAAQAVDADARPRERAELLLLHAQLCGLSGQTEAVRQAVLQLESVARAHGYWDLIVRGARLRRPTHLIGGQGDVRARRMLEDALSSAPPEQRRVRVSALSQLAFVPPYALDIERSKELSGEALALARQLGEDGPLLEALQARLYGLGGPDDIEALLAAAREMLARDHTPPTWSTMDALIAIHGAELCRGDMEAADAALASIGQCARQQKWPEAIWGHARMVTQRRILRGEFQQAEASISELEARARRLRIGYAAPVAAMMRILLLGKRDGPAAIAPIWQGLGAKVFFDGVMPGLRPSLARMSLSSGQSESARAVLQGMVRDDGVAAPREVGFLNAVANLALIAIELRDKPRARCLYEVLAPYPHHNTPTCLMWYDGSVSYFLARLAAADGRSQVAAGHFDDAIAMNEALGARPQLAETYYEYARFALRSGAGVERVQGGRELQAKAVALAGELGMAWLVELARSLA